ncbi:MAG: type II secretion system protein [Candidatus Taylorbacteria bacterium]|nr:type II secretion system protein [Candidatus Taylorbacteria bacterium]
MKPGIFNPKSKISGFTLVEMLVVLGIFAVLTTIVVIGSNSFNSSVVLTNAAYNLAQDVREMQVYAVSVREDAPGSFGSGAGARFALGSSYTLFTDLSSGGTPDRLYSGPSETLRTTVLPRQIFISKICAGMTLRTGYDERCTGDGRTPELGAVDVSFLRPALEPAIRGVYTAANSLCSGNTVCAEDKVDVYLTIPCAESPCRERRVSVNAFGRVEVN